MRRRTILIVAFILLVVASVAALSRRKVRRENLSIQILGTDFRENPYSGDVEEHVDLQISNSSLATVALRISALETNGPFGWTVDEAQVSTFRAKRFIRVDPKTEIRKIAVVPGVHGPWRARVEVYRMPGHPGRLAWAVSGLLRGESLHAVRENWQLAGHVILADADPLFECVSGPTAGLAGRGDPNGAPATATAPLSDERLRSTLPGISTAVADGP